MPKKLYPHDLLAQTRSVLAGLEEIKPVATFAPLDPAALTADVGQIHHVDSEIRNLKAQLVSLQNQRESLCISAWDKVKRIRFGVKALYGDDSSQYELVGGTRVSDRKPWMRRQAQKQG
jgi:hypothetical protein